MSALEFDDRGRLYRLREVGGHHRLELQSRPDTWEPVPAIEALQVLARGVGELFQELEARRAELASAMRPRTFIRAGDMVLPMVPWAPAGRGLG